MVRNRHSNIPLLHSLAGNSCVYAHVVCGDDNLRLIGSIFTEPLLQLRPNFGTLDGGTPGSNLAAVGIITQQQPAPPDLAPSTSLSRQRHPTKALHGQLNVDQTFNSPQPTRLLPTIAPLSSAVCTHNGCGGTELHLRNSHRRNETPQNDSHR